MLPPSKIAFRVQEEVERELHSHSYILVSITLDPPSLQKYYISDPPAPSSPFVWLILKWTVSGKEATRPGLLQEHWLLKHLCISVNTLKVFPPEQCPPIHETFMPLFSQLSSKLFKTVGKNLLNFDFASEKDDICEYFWLIELTLFYPKYVVLPHPKFQAQGSKPR